MIRPATHVLCGAALLVGGAVNLAPVSAAPADRAPAGATQSTTQDDSRQALLDRLWHTFDSSTGWVRLHAAEALSIAGEQAAIRLKLEAIVIPPKPPRGYRIGIWRILGRVTQVRDVALDAKADDQLFAIESLAKMKYAAAPTEQETLRAYARSAEPDAQPMAWWVLVNSGDPTARPMLWQLLESDHALARARSAYALRQTGDISPADWDRLRSAAAKDTDPLARTFLYAAAYCLAPTAEQRSLVEPALVEAAAKGAVGPRREAIAALGASGSDAEAKILLPFLSGTDPDVQTAAVAALLHIQSAQSQPASPNR